MTRGRTMFVAMALGTALVSARAGALTITVDTTTAGAATDGHCSLAEAIQAANTDAAVDTCAAGLGADTIQLAAASYEFLQGFDASNLKNALPAVTTKVTIVGATADTSILTMNAVATDLGFFRLTQSGNLTLRHLTLSNGTTTGGVVLLPLNGGTLTVDDCTITRNGGANLNAAITGGDSTSIVTITGSRFIGNKGRGLQMQGGGTVSIDTTTFSANGLTPVDVAGGDLTITGSTFDENALASQDVSAVKIGVASSAAETAHISGCQFTGNSSVAGPAVFNNHGVMTVTTSLFAENDGGSNEGGAIDAFGETHVDRCLFHGNRGDSGAAIRVTGTAGQAVTITNSTFTGNHSTASGGAIWSDSTLALTLNNVTVYGNAATASGGGLMAAAGGLAALTLSNTILAGNTAGGSKNDCGTGSGRFLTSSGYNLIGTKGGCTILNAAGDQIGTDQAPIDPKLAPLADNGGPTETLGLFTGSPAIDHGSPAGDGGVACEPVDQTGKARPVGAACDIGAFEGMIAQVVDAGSHSPPDASDASRPMDAGAHPTVDAGTDAPVRDAAVDAPSPPRASGGGCGCRTAPDSPGTLALPALAVAIALAAVRRRPRARS